MPKRSPIQILTTLDVALLTALVSGIFIRIVKTIIVAITNINAGYAVAIITREEITKAGSALALTILGWFIRPV